LDIAANHAVNLLIGRLERGNSGIEAIKPLDAPP
jgi:hypothetical protein